MSDPFEMAGIVEHIPTLAHLPLSPLCSSTADLQGLAYNTLRCGIRSAQHADPTNFRTTRISSYASDSSRLSRSFLLLTPMT